MKKTAQNDKIGKWLRASGLPAKAEALADAGGRNCMITSIRRNRISMFYTYVLKSQTDAEFYIGWTDILSHRINMHNEGQVKSTIKRKPFDLVYFEACLDKEKAIKREKQLKTGFGRKYLDSRI